jgi:hypothetical protein
MKFILYSSFLFLLAPCNGSKKAISTTNSNSTSASATTKTNTSPKTQNDLRTVSIIYRKTPCFGTCAAFTLTVNGSSNSVTYKGDLNVEKIGNYEKNISDDELTKLVNAFDKKKFFEFKDGYKTPATDIPSKLITYSINGKTKKVEDQQNAPAELKELEKLLDEIADSNGWKKVKDPE